MLAGEMLMFALLCIVTIGNCAWAIVNWRIRHESVKNFSMSHRLRCEAFEEAAAIRNKAVNEVLEFRAGQFKVCGNCGRIVQGLCLECVAKIAVEG